MESSFGSDVPQVAIVVLNYRSWKETVECLESLQALDYPNYTVIVVDNGSGDGSVEKIKQWAEGNLEVRSEYVEYKPELKPVFYVEYDRRTAEAGGIPEKEEELEKYPPSRRMVIIQTGKNLGFSGGNNVGAKFAFKRKFNYILLLNNDTLIIDKDFLWKLIQPLTKFPEAGLVGPKTINFSGEFDGPYIEDSFIGELFWMSVKNFARKILGCPSAYIDIKALSKPYPTEVYKISGVALFLEVEFFAKLGFLDERLWLSSEEAALAEAVRKTGKKVFFQPLTLLLHKKAASPRDQSWYVIKKNAIKQREFFLKEYKGYSGLKFALIKLFNRLRLLLSKLHHQVRRF